MIKNQEITKGDVLIAISFFLLLGLIWHVFIRPVFVISRDIDYNPKTSIEALTSISSKGNIEKVPDGEYLLVFNKNRQLSIAFQEDSLVKIQQLNIKYVFYLKKQIACMNLPKFRENYIENCFDENDFEETIPKSNYYYFLHVENGYGEVYFRKLYIEPRETDVFLVELYRLAKQSGIISK